MNNAQRLKIGIIIFVLVLASFLMFKGSASRAGNYPNKPDKYELPYGENPFAPSNARTANADFIRQADFIPAARCAECHRETHREWSESAHRNAFREPFYQANVEHLIRDRGI